jgi:hypothetical protein
VPSFGRHRVFSKCGIAVCGADASPCFLKGGSSGKRRLSFNRQNYSRKILMRLIRGMRPAQVGARSRQGEAGLRFREGTMTKHRIWFGALKCTMSVLGVFVAAMSADSASSQSNRTIKIVITFPVGSGGDVLTRAMAEQISRAHGPRFTFENTDQFLGAEVVARAVPDEHAVCSQQQLRRQSQAAEATLRSDLQPSLLLQFLNPMLLIGEHRRRERKRARHSHMS